MTVDCVELTIGGPGEKSSTVAGRQKFVGTIKLDREEDYPQLNKIFRGSRMCKGGKMVNESISSSLDPLNLSCLSCAKEHKLGHDSPPIVAFLTDQNMVPVVGDCTKNPTVVI